MADSQLTDYIKKRVQEGAKRMEISVELVQSGWPPAQINEALSELQVPMDGAPPPPPTPALPQAPMMQSVPSDGMPPVGAGPAMPSQPAMPVQEPPRTRPYAVPGVFALIGEAFDTYKSALGPVLGIGALGFLLTAGLQVVVAGAVIAGVMGAIAGGTGAIVTVVVIIVALMVVAGWIGAVLGASIAHAMKGESFGHAFGKGFKQSLSYLWLGFLSTGLLLGYLLVFAVLPSAIGFAVLMYAFSAGSIAVFVVGAYAVIAAITTTVIVAAKYSTAVWILIEGEAKGVRALILSARRVKPQLGSVGLRMLLGIIIYVIVYFVIGFLGGMAAAAFGGITRVIVQMVIGGGFTYLFFLPLMLGFLKAIHASVQPSVSAETFTVSGGERWGTLGLAWLGFLLAFVLPFGFAAMTASLGHARTVGNEAAVKSDMATVQTEAEIYYGTNNSYSTAQTCSEGMFATDPVISQALSAVRSSQNTPTVCTADGANYLVFAMLPSGGGWCVDNTGYSGTASLFTLAGTKCSASEATTTPAQ